MNISKLVNMINESNYIVFFGGAGVSTESGIPDFRSTDGIYNQKYKFPPETILSHSFFESNTNDFYDFYKEKMIFSNARPNKSHVFLSYLEKKNKLKAVITQNIDGLHQAAGSKNVLELHGSVHRNYCLACNKFYDLNYIIKSVGIPKCDCGGTVKPDVVLYEEMLNENIMISSISHIENADMLIIGGTSLGVYPAAGLTRYFKGDNLVLINKSVTSVDEKATLVFRENIGEILGSILL